MCLCFQSREQVNEFCEWLGFEPSKFLLGNEVMVAMQEELESKGVKYQSRTASTLARNVIEELADKLPQTGESK